MKLRIEKWKSSDNNSEIHFYLQGKKTETYLCGFNRKHFNNKKIEKIIKMAKKKNG